MGHSWVEVEISDWEKKKSTKVKALVDTGSTLTILPEKLAKELGIEFTEEAEVRTGGGLIKMKRGKAFVKIKGKEELTPVLISDVIDKVLIGVVILESLGLKVDPLTGALEETSLLLY